MVKDETKKTFQAAHIKRCTQIPWSTMKDKIRYVAYLKEMDPETNQKYFRVFAYAKSAIREPAWRKLFQVPSEQPFQYEKIRGYFEQFAEYKALLEEGRLKERGQRPSLRARPNLQAAKLQK
jgi:hypothetical protein